MKTTALPVSRQQFPSWSGLIARVPDFIALTKPRVMALAVFTAAVGLFVAPGQLDPLLGAISLIGIAAGAGAAGVLNMWYDADIDAAMTRTAGRPIPDGKVSRAEALGFGLALACRNVSTTLIHPGSSFRLASDHLSPPFLFPARIGLPANRAFVRSVAD